MAQLVPSAARPDSTWAVLRLGEPPTCTFRDRDLATIQAGVENARSLKNGDPTGFVVRLWSFGRLRPHSPRKEPTVAETLAERYRRLRAELGPDHPATRDAFEARLAEARLDEMLDPQPGLWWLSFCDPERPEGEQFLGVAIVEADGMMAAITESHRRGINPGGEIQTAGPIPPNRVHPGWRNRLLSRTEAEAIGDQEAALAAPPAEGGQ